MRNPISAAFSYPAFSQRAVLAFTAAVAFSAPAWAQRPAIRRALVTNVRPDRIDDFVRDYDKWTDLDAGPVSKALAANPVSARINQRIMSYVESSTMLVEELLPELSAGGSPADPPPKSSVSPETASGRTRPRTLSPS